MIAPLVSTALPSAISIAWSISPCGLTIITTPTNAAIVANVRSRRMASPRMRPDSRIDQNGEVKESTIVSDSISRPTA